MAKQMRRLSEVLMAASDESDFTVTLNWINVSGTEETLTYNGYDIVDDLVYRYGDMYYFYNTNSELELIELYQRYLRLNKVNWSAVAKAYFAEYNPIDNYNMIETGNDSTKVSGTNSESNAHTITADGTNFTKNLVTHKTGNVTDNDISVGTTQSNDTMTVSSQTTDTETPNNYTVTRNPNITTTESPTNRTTKHYTTTFDDVSDGRLDSYDVTSGDISTKSTGTESTVTTGSIQKSGNNSTNQTNTIGDVINAVKSTARSEETLDTNTTTINNNTTYTHTLTRSGNIGVTTTAQMITQELELRLFNLFNRIVNGFVNTYCFYLDSIDWSD